MSKRRTHSPVVKTRVAAEQFTQGGTPTWRHIGSKKKLRQALIADSGDCRVPRRDPRGSVVHECNDRWR